MGRKAKQPAISYGVAVPQTFGAAGDAINNFVTFGIGTLNKIVPCSDTSLGLIAFGYNTELKSGAIAVGGELVSSKILDISTNATEENPKPTIVTVKYLDSSIVKDFTFGCIDPSIIEALDSSLSNLYQEVIDNEEVLVHYFEKIDTSINNNTDDITYLKNVTDIIENNYVKSINAIDSSAIIVNNITPSNVMGKQYEIGIAVDDNTVKIEQGKLTAHGYTYTIKSTAIPTDGFLKTYQLYETDPAGNETAVTNAKIDIPKDFVLKDAHLCKATTTVEDNVTIYTETAKATDPDFDEAAGDLYLHFIWQTKDSSALTSETFIKVTDMAPIYTGDANADPSDGKYVVVSESHVISLDTSKFYDDLIEPLDASMKNIFTQLINDEYVLTQYFSILDTSINQNTYDISILRNDLNSSFVSNVSAYITNTSLIIVNPYTPDYEDPNEFVTDAVEVADASITYRITKTINGIETDVVMINTVNPSLIENIATILTDHSKRLDETENTMKWITL